MYKRVKAAETKPAEAPRTLKRAIKMQTWRVVLGNSENEEKTWTGKAETPAHAIHLAACWLGVFCPQFGIDSAYIVACKEVMQG